MGGRGGAIRLVRCPYEVTVIVVCAISSYGSKFYGDDLELFVMVVLHMYQLAKISIAPSEVKKETCFKY